MAKATIKDISRLSGWSLGTVSRVLNHEDNVSDQAVQEVIAAAQTLGYTRNEAARALRSKHTRTIDLLYDPASSYCASLAQACAKQFEKQNHQVRLVGLDDTAAKDAYLSARQMPLLILFFGTHWKFITQVLGRKNIPAICVTSTLPAARLQGVEIFQSNDSEASLQGVEWLFEAGCTQVGCLLEPPESSDQSASRLLGVQYAFYSRNMPFSKEKQAVFGVDTLENGYDGLKTLHERLPGLDGLFVSGSLQAAGALRALADLGLNIPLLCFDERSLGEYTIPRLSGFRRNVQEEAEKLAQWSYAVLHQEAHESLASAKWSMRWADSCPCPKPDLEE